MMNIIPVIMTIKMKTNSSIRAKKRQEKTRKLKKNKTKGTNQSVTDRHAEWGLKLGQPPAF